MVMKGVRAVFIDTNILLRANVAEGPFHQECLNAIAYLRAHGDELWISRQILREYISVLTRPQEFANPRPVSVIAERVRYFQMNFRVADETFTVTRNLLLLLEKIPMGGRQVHDANIVATMQAYGIRHLVTLNTADFARFSGLITLLSLEDIKQEQADKNSQA
jgi:predicted nucleic acid-binding protein